MLRLAHIWNDLSLLWSVDLPKGPSLLHSDGCFQFVGMWGVLSDSVTNYSGARNRDFTTLCKGITYHCFNLNWEYRGWFCFNMTIPTVVTSLQKGSPKDSTITPLPMVLQSTLLHWFGLWALGLLITLLTISIQPHYNMSYWESLHHLALIGHLQFPEY